MRPRTRAAEREVLTVSNMAVQVTNPALRLLALVGILAISALLAFLGCRHAIVEHWAGSPNADQWLLAARWEPANPENWYRLGRYRQLDFENSDLQQAILYYRRATTIDPKPARYWLDLAEAYETAGNAAQAEDAFRKAQQDYPISADVAWRFGNFLLRQGREQEAFQQIDRAVSTDRKLTPLALSLCWRSTQDIDLILRAALPADPDVDWDAIRFFVDLSQPDAAIAVWKRLLVDSPVFPISRALPLVDMLIGAKRADDAETVWQRALSVAGVAPPPGTPHSLVWDGGFEAALLNGGFAWRYRPIQGAQMDLDEENVHSGSRSLRVVFDGSENVDFANLWQIVIVQPNTRYSFSAYLRTEELTTESAIRFEISDANNPADLHVLTSGAIGTQPWTLDGIGFTTGSTTRLLLISLRRTRSTMLANKVRGTAWVDDVSLIPATEPGLASQ
jgi:tetratricopeptide (TPR) repeat protein